MHQTFYIDIDEEITSVVERLRKAREKEIVIVVPKRALLVASIVNLRLLKKEASNLGLAIMIVTQDKLGKLLVEKAGILVQQNMDDLESEIGDHDVLTKQEDYEKENMLEETRDISGASRLKNFGSSSFYDERDENRQPEPVVSASPEEKKDKEVEKIINKELVSGIGSDIRRKRVSKITEPNIRVEHIPEAPMPDISKVEEPAIQTQSYPHIAENINDRKIESFFHHPDTSFKTKEKEKVVYSKGESSGVWKKALLVIMVLAVISLGYGGYTYGPKAKVILGTKNKVKAVDSKIRGDVKFSSIDYEKEIIPAQHINVTEEISRQFPSTGKKSVSNQKAKGTITIYNEYGTDPQPLVPTTRFLSSDGKIFRLVKGVTVPGTAKVGVETKPGVVEAEVVADSSGADYNIGPGTFTIPGFKDSGNDKYTKFYAKSTSAMTGGGSKSDEAKVVSEEDINAAKNKLQGELKEAVKKKLKETAGGTVILDESIQLGEATYKVSNSVEEMSDKFEVKAEVKAEAIVFSESDVKEVVNKIIARTADGKIDMGGKSVSLEYGHADVDFKLGTVEIKVHGAGKLDPNINLANLKKEILGKTNEEVGEYLSSFSYVETVEVIYWPSFINKKIPTRESRVEMVIEGVDN